MPKQGWEEIRRIVAMAGLAVAVGFLFGHLSLVLAIFFAGLFLWYFRNLLRLQRWLQKGKKYVPPLAGGLWGEVFNGIYRLQQRSRARNKRIVKLLNRFRESTAALPDGVVVLDRTGNIEWWNESAEKLLGLRYPADVGQRLTNLIRNPDFVRYFGEPEPEGRVEFESPRGQDDALLARRVPYGNKQELVLIRDVTLFRRVEDMRRDFVANISHELRTPLTVMRGFLENLVHEGVTEEERQRAVELMSQQAARMQGLVEDLMMLSRLENQETKVANEVVIVPQLLTALQEEAALLNGEKQHHIRWDVDKDLYLRGNSKELDSAFMNLLVNAINYTPPGGEIMVRWYAADDGGACFEVQDNGIGIAPQHIARLTERFYRVDVARSRESGGSGLGLAIVKHILGRHDGQLDIRSQVNRGSTFTCRFPTERVAHAEQDDSLPPAASS